MRTQKNHSVKIILLGIIVVIGIALIFTLTQKRFRSGDEKQILKPEIIDLSHPKIEGNDVPQDILTKHNPYYHRTFRTLLTDPADNQEKMVELRYSRENVLIEIVVEDKTIPQAELNRYKALIIAALTEERAISKETYEMRKEIMELLKEAGVTDLKNIDDQFASAFGNDRSDTESVNRNKDGMLRKLEELESSPTIKK